jgi:hypothetical protein
MVLLDGETNTPQTRDKFYFYFFPISIDHVYRINAIMLQEAYETSVIAFKTTCGARRALEFYLGMSCERGFKTISDAVDDPRLAYLKMLQQVDTNSKYRDPAMDGPEDVIANGETLPLVIIHYPSRPAPNTRAQ